MSVVSAEPDLLYPLSWFHQTGGSPLPAWSAIDGQEVPEPYRGLLVHRGDMTSRLEAFHGGSLALTVLHREHTESLYRREVVLRVAETGQPVEYGAIEIALECFSPALRAKILEEHLPLGGLLNTHEMRYTSRPRAFLHLAADERLSKLFGVEGGTAFFGRSNEIFDEQGRVLARIVEVLPPAPRHA